MRIIDLKANAQRAFVRGGGSGCASNRESRS
jgi:hypothetical protein